MHTPAAKKQRKTTISQGIAPHSSTITGNSGPVSVFFISGELTGKERDPETGLYYYGARYLDPQTSRWISADPAMWEGDYIPSAPINDKARERNQNLPGMGGIFNYVNFHVYHYGGNNPVRLVDPDGRTNIDIDNKIIHADLTCIDDLELANRQLSVLQTEGYRVIASDGEGNEMHFRSFGALTQFLDMVDSRKLSGTFFLGLDIDLVAINGIEFSIYIAIDFDDLLNSGLNFTGGISSGANVGVAVVIGYVRGSIEGYMPLGFDANIGKLPISVSILSDEHGISGGSIGVGPGGGISLSSQYSWTLSPRKVLDWVNSWRK